MPFANTQVDESVIDAIAQASPDAILLINEDDRILEFNRTAEVTFGYSREQALGRRLSELIIASDDRATYTRAKQIQSNNRLEIEVLRADGTTLPVELTMVSVGPPDGGRLYVLFIRDISLLKANDSKLRRMSARLFNMVANLQGGIVLVNEDRHIELVNGEFCAMFNIAFSPEELTGITSTQLIDHMLRLVVNPEEFQDRIREIGINRQFILNDIVHLTHGRVLSRDYIPIYDDGVYLGSLSHFHDVTKEFETRKRWEKLLNLEELNKEIIRIFLQVDSADEAITHSLALAGQLLDVSRAYVFRFRETERLLDNTHEWHAANVKPEIDTLQGIQFDELMPSLFPILAEGNVIAPYHISTLPADIRNMFESQGIQSLINIPLYTDGRIEGFIGCTENRYPREWLPEEIASFRLIAESYSRALERQKIERDLIQARDTALRTAQVRSQFVANMSHEIRTPMTGVLGMLELLNETKLDEDQSEFAQTALTSASRLVDIINDILDFSKLDAGFVLLETEPVILTDVANEVRATVALQRGKRPVEIQIDIAPDVPARVKGDPTRLRQILMNLVGNSVKFTREGYVWIRMQLIRQQAEYVRIRFEVADTGIGIEQANLETIFDSFIQVDGSVTRKYGGTGLGLSITKQLVELMGGRIEVESTVGQGSTFRFELTMLTDTSEAALPSAGSQTIFNDLKVMVVDDDRTSRYLFTQQLKNYGVHVTGVDSSQIADFVQKHAVSNDNPRYDLIFVHTSHNAKQADAENLRLMTTMQAMTQVISLVDHGTSELLPSQMVWRVGEVELYNVLQSAAESASMEISVLETADESIEETSVETPQGIQATRRILLVEDYPMNAMLVVNALEQETLNIDIVENGLQALDQLERARYDLILMDMEMPVMSGTEATQWIRRSATAYQSIPILAVTANVMKDQRDSYLEAGVNEIITKPFVLAELRETIRRWLSL